MTATAVTLISLFAATSIPMGFKGAYLLPRFLVSHLVLILGLILYTAGQGQRIRQVLAAPRNRVLLLSWGAFLGWMFIASLSSPLSTGRMLSLGMGFKQLVLPLLVGFVVLAEEARDSKHFTKSLRNGLLISGCAFFGFGLLEFLLPGPIRQFVLVEVRIPESLDNYGVAPGDASLSAAGLFAHYNLFGVNQALCLLLLLPEWFDLIERRFRFFSWSKNWPLMLMTGAFVLGTVISNSKSAILGLSLGICFQGALRWRDRVSLRVLLALFAASCLSLGALAALSPHTRARIAPVVQAIIGEGRLDLAWQHFLNGRQEVYSSAFEMIRRHPLKGIGFFQTDNYIRTHQLPFRVIHNHNIVLEFWVAGGLVGLVLFGVLIWVAFFRGKRRVPVLWGSLFAMLLGAQLFDVFVVHELWFSVFFFCCLVRAWGRPEEV